MRVAVKPLAVGLLLGVLLMLAYQRVVKAAPVEARWFAHKDQPLYVRNLECHEKANQNVGCSAVVENTSQDGIASIGMKWEQLGQGQKILRETWETSDFNYKHPNARPNRQWEGKSEEVFDKELQATDNRSLIHLHFVYVEMKDGSVIPPAAADSFVYKEVIRARLAAENNE